MEAELGRGALPRRGQLSDFSWAHPHPWRGAPGCVSGGGSGLPAVGSKLQAAPTDPASGATEGDGLLSLAREVSRGGGRRGLTGGTRLGVLWRTLTPLAS